MVGTADEHSRGYGVIREILIHLDQKIDRVREELCGRIEALHQKFSRYFLWMIGIQITILLAVIGALLAS